MEGGIAFGGGLVDEHVALMTAPWFAVSSEAAKLSLQAPLIMNVDTGQLRRNDWDQPGDYSKLIRRLEVGQWLRMGPLRDRTIGNGTIVRRYHNGTDPDHGRLAIDLIGRGKEGFLGRLAPNHLEAFADNIFHMPVFGAAAGYRKQSNFALLSVAADLAAPNGPIGPTDDTKTPRAKRDTRLVAGISGRVRATPPRMPVSIDVHSDLNTLDMSAYGAHLGLSLGYEDRGLWTVKGGFEAMVLGAGYTWSLFDHGYLIDRWTGLDTGLKESKFALGGRFDLQVGYANALIIGGQFANCSQAGRADLSAFLRVPLKRVTLSAFWRVRRPRETIGVLKPKDAMVAIATQFILTSPLSAQLMVARDWRVSEGQEVFRPTTTALFTLQLRWPKN